MIRNIHISNYLSCSLSGQITKVLLYCHDCVYIYWAFHNYSADSLFSPIYQGKASFISWLSSRNFFRGGKIYCYANFYCYSIIFGPNFREGRKFSGGQTASGGAPCPTLWKKASIFTWSTQTCDYFDSLKMFTEIGYIFTLKTDNKLLSSFGNNRLVPLTTHFIDNALIALITCHC